MGQSYGKPGFRIKLPDIPRVNPEILEELKKFSTANISDGMNRFGAMDPRIKPIRPGFKVVGPAVTVRLRPGDNLMAHKAIDLAQPGDVIVIDAQGCCTNAVWGELMSLAAIKKGLKAMVIDGAVRDSRENREIGFPLFAKAICPTACDKDGPGEINVPIACGGVAVLPGDIVIGDDDGVVVVPREDVLQVLEEVRKKLEYEEKRKLDIQAGVIVGAGIDRSLRDKGVIA
jgi:regulator of RNase E activity RraA